MADSNFQDIVVLTSATLSFLGEQFVVGSGAGAKSVVFANAGGAVFLHANPTATRSVSIQDASGTLGLITGISAGTTRFSNGELVFSNSNGVSFGINGSTITASMVGGTGGGGGVMIQAGTQTATSGTVIFSNANNVTFGMSGSSVITASAEPDVAFVMCLLGV